jgi:hypothetical protein
MWMRVMTAFPISILEEPLFHYRHAHSQVSAQYNQLRTFEEHFFPIMDLYLDRSGMANQLEPDLLAEYSFHRAEDRSNRALNLAISGDPAAARDVLRSAFPWRSIRVSLTRRKIRVALVTIALRIALPLGLGRICANSIKAIDRLAAPQPAAA